MSHTAQTLLNLAGRAYASKILRPEVADKVTFVYHDGIVEGQLEVDGATVTVIKPDLSVDDLLALIADGLNGADAEPATRAPAEAPAKAATTRKATAPRKAVEAPAKVEPATDPVQEAPAPVEPVKEPEVEVEPAPAAVPEPVRPAPVPAPPAGPRPIDPADDF